MLGDRKWKMVDRIGNGVCWMGNGEQDRKWGTEQGKRYGKWRTGNEGWGLKIRV